MDFELTDEQQATLSAVKKFLARECTRETARELDDRAEFPAQLYQTIAGIGICGLAISEEFGGVGPDTLAAVLAAEEIATISPVLGGVFAASALGAGRGLMILGSEEQKKRFLPGIAEGKVLVAWGIDEPGGAYSPVPLVKTNARLQGDMLCLNGRKTFVHLAERSDHILTLAVTNEAASYPQGLSFLIVDARSPGISISGEKTVGFKGMGLGQVDFHDVKVPVSQVLGGPECLGRGIEQLGRVMENEHLAVAAVSVGLARGALEYAVNYARERVQFGRSIIEFGAIEEMLVDMATAIESARLMTYRAACQADRGESFLPEAAMARTCAQETARNVSLKALHVLGGYGYAVEYDAQRYVRDSLTLMGGGRASSALKKSVAGRLAQI